MLNLFTSHAKDIYLDRNLKVTKEISGGPALFIENVLKENNVKYVNHYKSVGIVKILINEQGEFGKIEKAEKLKDYPDLKKDDFILISTLLDEIDLSKFSDFENIFLDAQGYVRNPSGEFGSKILYKMPDNFKPKILKVTELESTYLTKDFIMDQKNRILLVTKGEFGLDVYKNNIKRSFLVTNKIKSENTVGAGDTFFSNFVLKFMENKNTEESIYFAQSAVEVFLLKK
jgi:hypothetical protein